MCAVLKQESTAHETRILIVDDEDANLRLLENLLELAGYSNYVSVKDPREAIPTFVSFRPDLVLLDLLMPHIDGLQVMEQLRLLIPGDDFVPIVILTADASFDTKRNALRAGAADFLTKPLDLAEVTLRVRNLLARRSLHTVLKGQNALLDKLVCERTGQLERAQREALMLLARSAEYRDDDTGEHTQRVGANAGVIGRTLGLSNEEADVLSQAAPLHDIGKIGIPDSVLLKPASLTTEEFDTIKTHTLIGKGILAGSSFAVIQTGESIAYCHHERWDGKGYPRGLSGEYIPLEARITTVVDVFDALTHDRPYKKAWPAEQALAELEKSAGIQFDPRVVGRLVKEYHAGRLRI